MTLAWYGPQVMEQANRAAGAGLLAGAKFLTNSFKQTLSVPAPRVRVMGKRGKNKGIIYYRATVKATPGAPPRKLSGRLRAGHSEEISGDGLTARSGTNVIYAARHEKGMHPYMQRTVNQVARELDVIIGTTAQRMGGRGI